MGASEDRIAEKVASKLAINLAAEVAREINVKLSDLHERQAVQGAKIDFLCVSITKDREERKAACDKHQKWTASIGAIVADHEALKNRAIGAAKVATITAPILGVIVAKWEKFKHLLG